MKKEEISEAMKDVKFVEKIVDIESAEEMQKTFAEKSINLSLEESQAVITTLKKLCETKPGEISDETLEEISGGANTKESLVPLAVVCGLVATVVIAGTVDKVYKICKIAKDIKELDNGPHIIIN